MNVYEVFGFSQNYFVQLPLTYEEAQVACVMILYECEPEMNILDANFVGALASIWGGKLIDSSEPLPKEHLLDRDYLWNFHVKLLKSKEGKRLASITDKEQLRAEVNKLIAVRHEADLE